MQVIGAQLTEVAGRTGDRVVSRGRGASRGSRAGIGSGRHALRRTPDADSRYRAMSWLAYARLLAGFASYPATPNSLNSWCPAAVGAVADCVSLPQANNLSADQHRHKHQTRGAEHGDQSHLVPLPPLMAIRWHSVRTLPPAGGTACGHAYAPRRKCWPAVCRRCRSRRWGERWPCLKLDVGLARHVERLLVEPHPQCAPGCQRKK